MSYLSKSTARVGLATIALAASVLSATAADFPDPGDTAALYDKAKAEGAFTWYDSGPLAPMTAVAGDFEKKYPGIKVSLTRIVGVAQYSRFIKESESGQYIADLVNITDEPSVADLIDRGLSAEWKVPTADRFPPETKIKNSAYAPYLIDVDIAYNTKKVSPEEVKILAADWNGILDPRFKGRIAVTDQKCGTCYGAISMFLDPKYSARFGWPFLQAVAAMKPAVYNDVIIPVDRIAAGEQDIYFMAAEGVNTNIWASGAPIAWVHPKPTPLFPISWYQISKNAPHPYAVRLFLNWLTSEDGARSIQAKYGGSTVISGVPDERPVAKTSWYMPVTDKYTPDWTRWTSNFDHDMEMWSKLVRVSN